MYEIYNRGYSEGESNQLSYLNPYWTKSEVNLFSIGFRDGQKKIFNYKKAVKIIKSGREDLLNVKEGKNYVVYNM